MAGHSSTSFAPSAYDLLHDAVRARRTVAAQEQRRTKQQLQVAALQQQAAELAARGVAPERLPNIHGQMSRSDLAAAQAHLNSFGGATGATSIAPRAAGEPITTESAPPAPVKDPIGDLPFRPRDNARDLVEAKRLQMGLPTNAEAEASATTNAAIAKAAGTGEVVATPYGNVSSRGKNWQEKVVEQYPEIGRAGTAANAAFVKAYKGQQGPVREGETSDPLQIAANIYSAKEADPTAPGGAAYVNPLDGLDIAPGAAPGAPVRPAQFAGMAVPPVDSFDYTPPTAGQAAGQAVRSGVGSVVGAVANPLRRAGNAINRGLEVGFGTVADAANQIINPGAKSLMLPDRPVLPVPATPPPARALADPGSPAPYPWSTPSTATARLQLDTDLGTIPANDEIINGYAQLEDDPLFRKRLVKPMFGGFNTGRR